MLAIFHRIAYIRVQYVTNKSVFSNVLQSVTIFSILVKISPSYSNFSKSPKGGITPVHARTLVQSSFSSDYPVRYYTFKTNVNFENCLFQIMYYYYTVNELRQKTYFFLVTRSLQIVLFKQQKIYSYIKSLCTL